jgi:hypothetical protein
LKFKLCVELVAVACKGRCILIDLSEKGSKNSGVFVKKTVGKIANKYLHGI